MRLVRWNDWLPSSLSTLFIRNSSSGEVHTPTGTSITCSRAFWNFPFSLLRVNEVVNSISKISDVDKTVRVFVLLLVFSLFVFCGRVGGWVKGWRRNICEKRCFVTCFCGNLHLIYTTQRRDCRRTRWPLYSLVWHVNSVMKGRCNYKILYSFTFMGWGNVEIFRTHIYSHTILSLYTVSFTQLWYTAPTW